MVSLPIIASLVEKLDHRIPEIRDRSMKAICLKVLSPLGETDRTDGFSVIPGLAHSILQWLNDRYGSAPTSVVSDCLSLIRELVSESESLRSLFVDAGGPAFIKDFGAHNPTYSEVCFEICTIFESAPALIPIRSSTAASDQATTVSVKAEPKPLDFEEERLFDLGVRIKFATSMTDSSTLNELASEVRFGIVAGLPSSLLVEKPYILEALLCQLSGKGPSASPVSELLGLGEALFEICDRISSQDLHSPETSTLVSSIILSALEGLVFRPTESELCLHGALTALGDHPAGSLVYLGERNLESIIHTLSRVVKHHFPETSYREERFTFADESSVSLQKWSDWSKSNRIVVEMVIEILHAICSPETAWLFVACGPSLLRHVTWWISDEGFYETLACRQLASKAAVAVATVDPLNESDFLRARELILALKKISSKSVPPFSDSEVRDLVCLWRKVPELLPDGGDPLSFIRKLFALTPGVIGMLASSKELGDALIAYLHELRPESNIASNNSEEVLLAELLLRTECSDPKQLVKLVNEKFGFTLPLLSGTSGDSSMEGLARSLFAHSEAARKQASLVLWKSADQSGMFVSDPWRGCRGDILKDYRIGKLEVPWEEIEKAIALALNERLSSDVRMASAVQACTLLASSSSQCVPPKDLISKLFSGIEKSDSGHELLVSLCHLATLMLDKGFEYKGSLSEFIPQVVRHLFSPDEEKTTAVMWLLSRVLFDRETVLGPLASACSHLYPLALRRIDQKSFHLLRGDFEKKEDSRKEAVSLRTLAICVSLYGLSDCSKQQADLKPVVLRLGTPPLVGQPGHNKDLARQCDEFAQKVFWPIRRNRKESVSHLSTVVSSVSALIDSASIWAGTYPLFACECLDLLAVVISRSRNSVKVSDVAVLPSAVCNFLSRSDQAKLSKPVNCGFRLLLALSSIEGLDMNVCETLAPLIFGIVSGNQNSASESACLWLLISQDSLRNRLVQLVGDSTDFCHKLLSLPGSELTRALRIRLVGLLVPDSCGIEDNVLDLFVSCKEALILSGLTPLVQRTVATADWEIVVKDWFEVSSDCELEARLKVAAEFVQLHESDIPHTMIQGEVWPKLFARKPRSAGVIDFAVTCLRKNESLFPYLSHSGLFNCLVFSSSLGDLMEIVNEALEDSNLAVHCQPALAWLGSTDCSRVLEEILREGKTDGFRAVELIAAILADQALPLAGGEKVLQAVSSSIAKYLDHPRLCGMITQVMRIPGLVSQPDQSISSEILELMHAHESVSSPNENDIIFAQIRLISCWVSQVGKFCPSLVQAFSEWFCFVWKTCLLSSNYIPTLTELVCGFLEVLAFADLHNPAWGPPLSLVLSFATRTEGVPVPLFSLCLSVAETAAPILANKAVTGRLVAALIETGDKRTAGMVTRLCASLTGCSKTGSEVLKNLDHWLHSEDEQVMLRLVASVVLSGGHNRTAVATSSELVSFLVDRKEKSEIASRAVKVLTCTNMRCQQAVAGNGG